jgi:hypothetical protein
MMMFEAAEEDNESLEGIPTDNFESSVSNSEQKKEQPKYLIPPSD